MSSTFFLNESIKVRRAPECNATNEKKDQRCRTQKRSGPPVQGHARSVRHSPENDEDTSSNSDEQPIERAARRFRITGGLTAIHTGFNVVFGQIVSPGFALRGCFPLRLLAAGGGRKCNSADS